MPTKTGKTNKLHSFTLAILFSFSVPMSADASGYLPLIDGVAGNMTLLPDRSPSTVTIITHQMIAASGAQNLAQAVALAPGMIYGARTTGQQSVSYLGLSDEFVRRLQVLINGMSVYTPTTGGVNWAMIPVNINDVERIEVLHGPSSALHAENAMMATINIVTTDPVDSSSGHISTTIDNRGNSAGNVAAALISGRTSIRASLSANNSDGTTQKDYPFDDASHNQSALLDIRHRGDKYSLSATLGGARSTQSVGGYDAPWIMSLPSYKQYYQRYYDNEFGSLILGLPTANGLVKLQAAEVRDAAFYTYMANAGKFSVPIKSNYIGQRNDLRLDYSGIEAGPVTLSFGVGARRDYLYGPLFIGPNSPFTNKIYNALAEATWDINQDWSIDGQVNEEHADLMGSRLSPSFAVNFHPAGRWSFRAGYAQGFRMPEVYEAKADSFVSFPPFGDVWLAKSTKNLLPELNKTIDLAASYETGKEMSATVRVFHSTISQTINPVSTPFAGLSTTPGYVLTFSNSHDDIEMNGAMGQLNWRHGPWMAAASYSATFTRMDETSAVITSTYQNSVPRSIANILVSYRLDTDTLLSADYQHLSSFKWAWAGYPVLPQQNDLTLRVAHDLNFTGKHAQIALIGEHLLGTVHDFRSDAGMAPAVALQMSLDW